MIVNHIDPSDDELSERLRGMDDPALLCYGQAARKMCTPEATMDHPSRALRSTTENRWAASATQRVPAGELM
jgi:hypothetical protein